MSQLPGGALMLDEDNRHTCGACSCPKGIDAIDDRVRFMRARYMIKKTALNIDHEKGLVHGADSELAT